MKASLDTAGGLNGSQAELSRDLWDLPLCHWGSTCVPCTGRRIPNHWTTGEVHMVSFLKSSVSYLLLAALHLLVWPLTKLGFSASAPWKEHWVGEQQPQVPVPDPPNTETGHNISGPRFLHTLRTEHCSPPLLVSMADSTNRLKHPCPQVQGKAS